MKFLKHDVVLVKIRDFQSKAGKNMTFLTLADTSTFENVDCLPSSDVNVSNLIVGSHYDCELDFGRYSTVNLLPIKK